MGDAWICILILPPALSFALPLAAGFGMGLLTGLVISSLAAFAAGSWAFRKFVRLERRTTRAERLAELGMLTGGLAHEIKNPLSTVQLNLQLLREDVEERLALLETSVRPAPSEDVEQRKKVLARMSRRLESLNNETGRLREILDDFLRYAGRLEVAAEPTDLQQLASDLTDFLAPQAQLSKVRLQTELQPVSASIDPRLVKQALLNLLLNAIQHTPEGGTITLSLAGDRAARGREGGVRLAVSDTGRGIEPSEQARVFDPYFSRRRGGTGLGLAMTRRIAEAHGGRIELQSEPGRGSTFTLVLPERPPAEVTEQ